jgi:hypothetical protein
VRLREGADMFKANKGMVLDKLLESMVAIKPEMHQVCGRGGGANRAFRMCGCFWRIRA